jgi:hypothetical protein
MICVAGQGVRVEQGGLRQEAGHQALQDDTRVRHPFYSSIFAALQTYAPPLTLPPPPQS